MQKEQSLTLDLATAKIEAYCSKAEHCTSEVVTKLKSWNINERQIAEIVARLCKEKYINDLRYSRCYVKDKFRYNHWGRIKIAQTLRFKNINENDIKEAIEEEGGTFVTLDHTFERCRIDPWYSQVSLHTNTKGDPNKALYESIQARIAKLVDGYQCPALPEEKRAALDEIMRGLGMKEEDIARV